MKKLFGIGFIVSCNMVVAAQNVGIGITTPVALLHVADSNVLFSGPVTVPITTNYYPPASGEGSRMMWYPQKAAFRVGVVTGDHWDKDSIGRFSVSFGYNTKATGEGSLATGDNTIASGQNSTGLGYYSKAKGYFSTSLGYFTNAIGDYSISMGKSTSAVGHNSTSMGASTNAIGQNSTSMGNSTSAVGNTSTSMGFLTSAPGTVAISMGDHTIASGGVSTSMGSYTTASGSASTSMGSSTNASGGISTSMGASTNASGDISTSMGASTNASGSTATSMGVSTTASGSAATSMGDHTIASGLASTSMGAYTTASGVNSTSMGYFTTASGYYATSMGGLTNASGTFSTSMGNSSAANAEASTSMGSYTIAKSLNSLVIGIFNDSTNINRLFEIGNGTGTNSRHNAMTVLTNGNIGIGNTAPDVPLSFANTVGSKIAFYSSGVNLQYGLGVQGGLLQIYSDISASDIAFGYGGSASFTEKVRIKGNGNVGIGTINPTRPLSFPPALGEKILLYPGGTGEVGIGVYGNELRIHSDYAAAKISFGYQDNAGNFTQTMWLNNTTSVLTVGGTAYPSDERFKKQITAIQNPLQKLMNLNGVEYFMRKDEFPEMNFSSNRQTGLIAQEVEKVMPSAVYEINNKGYKGVDYAKLIPLLIESIKEQNKKMDAQQKQIDEQRKMIEGLLKK